MGSFREALRTLNFMKDEGVFEDYAISGAMALVFWTEPVPTYDLDVLVFSPAPARPNGANAPQRCSSGRA
jgi:hypothetical protein